MLRKILCMVFTIFMIATVTGNAHGKDSDDYRSYQLDFMDYLRNADSVITVENDKGQIVTADYISLIQYYSATDQEQLFDFLEDQNLSVTVITKNKDDLYHPNGYEVESFMRSETKRATPKDKNGDQQPLYELKWTSIVKGTYQIHPKTNKITVLSKSGYYMDVSGRLLGSITERNYKVEVRGRTVIYSSNFEVTVGYDTDFLILGDVLIYPTRSVSITL